MIVYLARDIPAFVMYCVNGESGSSLLIESTDSMICILTSCLQQMQLVLTTLLQLVVWMHKQVTKQLHLMNLCSGVAKEM